MSQETSPIPEYRMLFDPVKNMYFASNGSIRVPVRRTIGWQLIQNIDAELGHPIDDDGLRLVSSSAAQRVFEYIQKFT